MNVTVDINESMNVTVEKTITVMIMLIVQTQMVASHVIVKMDIQEMEQHVMVNHIIMHVCLILLMNQIYLLFLFIN